MSDPLAGKAGERMSDSEEKSKTSPSSAESLEKSARRPRGARARRTNQPRKKSTQAQVAPNRIQINPSLGDTSSDSSQAKANRAGRRPAQCLPAQAGEQLAPQAQPETTSTHECNIPKTPTENPLGERKTEISDESGESRAAKVALGAESTHSSPPLACAKCASVTHQATNVSASKLDQRSTRQTNSTDANCSVNAVRVLFKDQNVQQVSSTQANHVTDLQPTTGDGEAQPADSAANQQSSTVSVINASRRLIERQIEAIQVADSRRWNFDFRNCRPLDTPGHRYSQFRETAAQPTRLTAASTIHTCRPLNDQTSSATNRFNNQTRWQPTLRGADCHHHLSDQKQEDD